MKLVQHYRQSSHTHTHRYCLCLCQLFSTIHSHKHSTQTHRHMHVWIPFSNIQNTQPNKANSHTSPSEDCSRRSFLHDAVKSPTPALTSTPLGASRVRVRVGDSNLRSIITNLSDAGSSGNSGCTHMHSSSVWKNRVVLALCFSRH